MGTDIHMFAEAREPGGPWRKVGPVFKNQYYDPDSNYWNHEKTDHPYDGRNYDLYAILANVRNGVGFAGIVTGDKLVPISEPRGLPWNVTPEVLAAKDPDYSNDESPPNLGEHDFSWINLRELVEYDWTQTVRQRGVVEWAEYSKLNKNGSPSGAYCAQVGDGTTTIEQPAAEAIVAAGGNPPEGQTHVAIWWEETYREAVGSVFCDETIAALQKLGGIDDVRIVFGFDS